MKKVQVSDGFLHVLESMRDSQFEPKRTTQRRADMRSESRLSHPHRWSRLSCGALGIGALAAAVPLGVAAQSESAGAGTLEQIIVTARRAEENLQDTPIPVTVQAVGEIHGRPVVNH